MLWREVNNNLWWGIRINIYSFKVLSDLTRIKNATFDRKYAGINFINMCEFLSILWFFTEMRPPTYGQDKPKTLAFLKVVEKLYNKASIKHYYFKCKKKKTFFSEHI